MKKYEFKILPYLLIILAVLLINVIIMIISCGESVVSTTTPGSSTAGGGGGATTTIIGVTTTAGGSTTTIFHNKIYAIGGTTNFAIPLNVVEEFDPATNSWNTNRTSMPTSRMFCAAATVNNKIYVTGGFDGTNALNTCEMYDPAVNAWSTLASMSTARHQHASVALNNKIYVIGGTNANATAGTALRTVEEFDPATNTWVSKGSLSTPRRFLCACVANGKIYAVCGTSDATAAPTDSAILNTVEIYMPDNDSWTVGNVISDPRFGAGCAGVGGEIVVMGGYTISTAVDSEHIQSTYKMTTYGSWTIQAPMPTPRDFFGAASIGNDIYAFGGRTAGSPTTSVPAGSYTGKNEKFIAGGWSSGTITPMPTARLGMAVATAYR